MKHLLIILSTLLLSSPVIGQETGVLFRDTPYSKWVEGGKKWFKSGDEKTWVKYLGGIKNGVPNGYESFTAPNGDKYDGGYKYPTRSNSLKKIKWNTK